MKTYIVIPLLALWLLGCGTTSQTIAYKTTGTVVITANTAMNSWLDYKNTHNVPADQVEKVKQYWDKFYFADQNEKHAIAAYKASGDTNSINLAISMANAASSELVDLIIKLLPPEKAVALKGK